MVKKIGVLVGSLRKKSYSRIVANAIVSQLPEDYEAEFIDINVPLFNQDLEESGNEPESWQTLRKQVQSATGFLFATPEYNRSIPGGLKNAIDVASRPYGQNSWDGKPALVASVTPGTTGAMGGNFALRQSMVFLNMPTVQQPEAYIGSIEQHIDANDEISDPNELSYFKSLATALTDLIEKLD